MRDFGLAVLLSLFAISTASAQNAHPKLKPLAHRIGSWTSDVEVNGQRVDNATSTVTWSWILGSQFLKGETYASLPDYGFEVKGLTIWGWSAEKNAVVVTDFNSNGESRQFEVEIEDGKITSPAKEGDELGVVKVVEEFGPDGPKSLAGVDADGVEIWKLTNFKKK